VRLPNNQFNFPIEIPNNFRDKQKVKTKMAKSNLLKDAIADAKTVRETAIANAKIALEEAFTPRLQSILSQKLQKEIDGEDEEEEDYIEEEYGSEDAPTGDSSSIGAGASADSGTNGKQPSGITTKAHTELGDTDKESSAVGSELDDVDVVREGEGQDEDGDGVIDDPTGASVTEDEDFDSDDEFGDSEEEETDELDLEAIIRELEGDFEGEDEEEEFGEDEFSDEPVADEFGGEEEGGEEPISDEPVADEFGGEESDEEDIDLDEILREMGYGSEENEDEETDTVDQSAYAEKEAELDEALKVIRSLKGTINEVNLLNAKLLYSNKLFRSYELTNEQKMKVIETLDRTHNVREVKLVFATLAESMKVGKAPRKASNKKLTESFASNVVKSTAPKKEIISESNEMADRFKQLANIKPLKG
jgi:hypothetical protein